MAALVTLEDAKLHLHLDTTTAHDADVTATIDLASAITIDYLAERADDTWTPETVPLVVKAAVLDELAYRFAHRGDDPATDTAHVDRRKHLLARLRDLAVA